MILGTALDSVMKPFSSRKRCYGVFLFNHSQGKGMTNVAMQYFVFYVRVE